MAESSNEDSTFICRARRWAWANPDEWTHNLVVEAWADYRPGVVFFVEDEDHSRQLFATARSGRIMTFNAHDIFALENPDAWKAVAKMLA